MRHWLFGLPFIAVGLAATAARAQPGVVVDNAAARLQVIAEPRANVSVTVSGGDRRLPRLTARVEGAVVMLDGGLGPGRLSCDGLSLGAPFTGPAGGDARHGVRVSGVGRLRHDQLPLVTAHVPSASRIAVSGAVWGVVGRSQALDLSNTGCGDWTIGDVAGRLTVSDTGSGHVTGGHAGVLAARVAGSGDVKFGDVASGVALDLTGAGEARVGATYGPVHIRVAGSGDVGLARVEGAVQAVLLSSGEVKIAAGVAPQLGVQVTGSGDFTFQGVAGAVSAAVTGSGDITVAKATGAVSKSVLGSGEVRIGG